MQVKCHRGEPMSRVLDPPRLGVPEDMNAGGNREKLCGMTVTLRLYTPILSRTETQTKRGENNNK